MSDTATQTKEQLAIGSDTQPINGSGQLVEQERQQDLDSGMIALWNSRAGSLDNFDGDDMQQFKRRMICMNDTEKGGDHLNETILVKYWMVHEVQIVNKDTGEVNDCYRVVLITPEWKAYAFVSAVLAKGVREIYRKFGTEPLDPPLAVQVKQKQTGGGKRCYTLVPVVDEEPAKKK